MTSRDDAYWPVTGSEPALLDVTLGQLLDDQATRYSDRPAVITYDFDRDICASWTYRDLKSAADNLARGLMGWGVDKGDHVAVMSPNRQEWVLLEYALAKIGAVLITVNPAFHSIELDYLLRQGQATHLIFAERYRKMSIVEMLTDMLAGSDVREGAVSSEVYPKLRGLAVIGDAKGIALPFDALTDLARHVSESALAARQRLVSPHDVMQIQYTSGTTGRPKGAMLTHHSTINNARLMGERAGFRADDVMLSAMPFFHTAGCVCNVIGMLAAGGCLVTMDAFDPEKMLALWEKHAATIINGVPTMYSRMLHHPDFQDRRTDSLRLANAGGTSIPPSLMRQLKEATGADPMIIMGMTECSPIITVTNYDDPFEVQISTAGTPLPHTEIRVINPETSQPCEWGEKGELCIRGYLVTKGYYDMPDKTAEAIDADGWLHSGDLAVLDRQGHLSVVGRLKDMIIRGGENVFPVEVEDFLLTHDAVSQAQVVGVPDADLGEEVFAFVLPKDGANLTQKELQDYCRANIARHKMPKYVRIVEAFPMTANGKIQKFALRDMAAEMAKEGG
ncbi:AMP-binding protein [Paracoccus aurantiacus]|uniref:3-methylmercaptopropionyl-CoA ligase n=1 Tax=Paracoccus aurantiacus TaxID=2599412 RepID=A0A5C6RUK3_9RHOB|nr:AMP-binding protein [Paracoccus aurantiacus]TXB65675.1 AMP-binding protein [Paracoccus aurantiacus]